MNKILVKIAKDSFHNEIKKLASSGVIGDVLTASFLASLLMTGAQHGHGMYKAKKAGATLKEALKSTPLPIGKEWKFARLNKNRKFNIPTKHISTPYKGKPAYEYHLETQRDLAKTVGVPLGFIYSQTGKSVEKKK